MVDDSEMMRSFPGQGHGSEFIANASLAVVVCADSNKSDVWVEDCSIAAITLQYAACFLGLGSCWAQIRNRRHDQVSSAEQYVQQLLGIPEHVKVESIIGIGHPAETPAPVPASRLQYEKIRRNGWEG